MKRSYKEWEKAIRILKYLLVGMFILILFVGIIGWMGGWNSNNNMIQAFVFMMLAFVLLPWFFLDLWLKTKKKKIKKELRLKNLLKWRKQRERKGEKLRKIRDEKEKKERNTFEKHQRNKGLELFENKWVNKKDLSKLKAIQIGLDKNFQNLSPYEFEKFVSKLFKAMGYKTRITQASNDYGIDVVAEKGNEKLAIQCKRYASGNPVGNRDVQRILGAMHHRNVKATHSLLITTSHFTVQAREQAKECATELWGKEELHKMVKKYLMDI